MPTGPKRAPLRNLPLRRINCTYQLTAVHIIKENYSFGINVNFKTLELVFNVRGHEDNYDRDTLVGTEIIQNVYFI